MPQTKWIAKYQLQCCSGYSPKPNCPRKLHLLMQTEYYIIPI